MRGNDVDARGIEPYSSGHVACKWTVRVNRHTCRKAFLKRPKRVSRATNIQYKLKQLITSPDSGKPAAGKHTSPDYGKPAAGKHFGPGRTTHNLGPGNPAPQIALFEGRHGRTRPRRIRADETRHPLQKRADAPEFNVRPWCRLNERCEPELAMRRWRPSWSAPMLSWSAS